MGIAQRMTTRVATVALVSALGAATGNAQTGQALRIDDPQLALSAPQSAADACLQGVDRPIVDGLQLIQRCSLFLRSPDLSPGEAAAAHLVRAAAHRTLRNDQEARADNLAAVQLYSSVIDEHQPYPEFVFRRGTAYHALGDVRNALVDYNKAIEVNPWNVTAFADRGLLLARYENQYALAAADFDQALKLSPDNVDILMLRGDTLASQGKFAPALADLDRAVALSPRSPATYSHRAAIYSRQGMTEKALKDYAQALAIDDDNVDALVNRGGLYAASGDGRSAVADMDRVLAAEPKNVMALYNRGYARFVMGQYDAAIEDYTAALKVAPDLAAAYTNRCLSAALAGRDKTTTLADCDRAVELMPARADVRETRGFVDLKYGDARTAMAEYEAALTMDSERPLSLYGRGIARRRLGDHAGALADRQAALLRYSNVDREFAPYGVE